MSVAGVSRPTLPALRTGLRRRLGRLRTAGWDVAQTALAAAVAWALASLVNDRPYFAPISAVISLGVARGRRIARAFELVIGVAVGIAVADLIVLALGTGTLVIALVVALAMLAALLVGAGTVLVNQAAVSAILVATLTPPSNGISPDRFVDALIGGAVALLVGQVLFPRDPLRALAGAARAVFD
ncbi:MAG TPA: FUSC family protein, partial [Solirubrobacteraceae bacterium]